jgi:ketosteroid isomerase-like protein
VKTFREGLENRDLDGLIDLMTEDVVFRSPAVHAPYQGREQLAGFVGRGQ